MPRIFKSALRILLIFVVALSAMALFKREEITRLLAVNSLFNAEKIVHNFSHMDEAFLNTPIARGQNAVSELPKGNTITLPTGIDDWIKERHVTSLVVLKDGQLVYEDYYLGTSADDLRISWSVAKSFLSALVGILLEEGKIASIDDPIIKYVPALKGSAYETASLRNVLQMSSGVTFDEDYLDKSSDINRMGREIALGGSLDDFAASLKDSFVQPGKEMQYPHRDDLPRVAFVVVLFLLSVAVTACEIDPAI